MFIPDQNFSEVDWQFLEFRRKPKNLLRRDYSVIKLFCEGQSVFLLTLNDLGTYQQLSAVNELASQFLKDERLSMKGVPKKLRAITDNFLVSEAITQKVAPISVLDPEF